jgi:hypothetical protein
MSAFWKLLREAAGHFSRFGYTGQADIQNWRVRLLSAVERQLDPEASRHRIVRALAGGFWKALGAGRIARKHGKVHKFSIQQLEPRFREELDRRMFAAAELLDGDRKLALERIQQRFVGMATAGANPGEAASAARDIGKAARDARAHERMVAVDQTKKLVVTLDEIIAENEGSIGGFWDATWDIERKHRPEHAARHDKFYLRRGSWADVEGLVRKPDGYMDEWDMPGVLINCRCEYRYVYDIGDLPEELLTAKGRKAA